MGEGLKEVPEYYRRNTRKEMSKYLPDNYNHVLEVGCGYGNFTVNLDKNVEYWGVEPEKDAFDSLNLRYPNTTFCGYFDDKKEYIPNDYFDVIICNDVIEHISDYLDFLSTLKAKLNSDGVLILSIPNVRYWDNLKEVLFKKDWEYKDSGILDRTHLRFFTKRSIIRMMNDNGYEIVSIEGINSRLYHKSSFKRLIKNLVYFWPHLVFGCDTQYLQFSVVAKAKK